eukprot:4687670-Prymnesium_polylepis.1
MILVGGVIRCSRTVHAPLRQEVAALLRLMGEAARARAEALVEHRDSDALEFDLALRHVAAAAHRSYSAVERRLVRRRRPQQHMRPDSKGGELVPFAVAVAARA